MAISKNTEVDAALQDPNHGELGKIIEEVRAAASEWGFFYVANHGLSEQEVGGFQTAMRAFFRLSKQIKRTIHRNTTNNRGYVEGELTKNKTDWKECFDFAGSGEDGPWLDETTLPGFRRKMRAYYDKMEHAACRLLKVFAVALGEEPAFSDQFFRSNTSSTMRLNYYPMAPEPEKTMGVYHHTDSGALTILLQDDEVASLQGTYTINIGDMMQVWSNDQFVAPLHRVVASKEAARFSAPFFYSPSYDVQVEPIVAKPGDVPNYRPISWCQFRLARFQGNYADLGKENQIGDYKIHGPIDFGNS
ncbi:2OG-Fe(II) oxygenase superfamily protein [Phytophthora infestans T30-4]|uniref:2OG-Fe(II) oxygenase superfamily protein n=1 Tax=Phytophthora infestans (strain T30-4) TaxID=403677 RepID=D0MRW2_PHYIT|nr:2OG-Fe(II) oxygenase superfamily protein [Phytophthora infestans T30-4]EEY58231.1 2OG-Fe(II) oxygenase superfamily protein [Phytophthora infestans T30-4]|eukprot:XP_002909417.1 2OG-Fe(II) oxygenase superfamily protein [Phytophthora infestans T30-4]